jgi:hypothetical protein
MVKVGFSDFMIHGVPYWIWFWLVQYLLINKSQMKCL